MDRVTRHLRRGEFLLLIIGDGIRESAENIVDFVQKHSGLHFNLALVEAALYRDKDNSVIVRLRILARTEIIQRVVFEEHRTPQFIDETDEEIDDVLSDLEQENLLFWTAVLKDFQFSDINVEAPEFSKDSTLYVKVRNSGYSGWGLTFVGYLYRNYRELGCNLSSRKGEAVAERTFGEIEDSWHTVGKELGQDFQCWRNKQDRPRIGTTTQSTFPFGANKISSQSFEASVAWMRQHLNVLVSTLHPEIQRLISRER